MEEKAGSRIAPIKLKGPEILGPLFFTGLLLLEGAVKLQSSRLESAGPSIASRKAALAIDRQSGFYLRSILPDVSHLVKP